MRGAVLDELVRRRNEGLRLKGAFAECQVRHADFVVEQARAGHITRSEAMGELEWLHDNGTLSNRVFLKSAGALLPAEGTGVTQW